ncbi:MAG: deoxyhypusine synthase [Candidatus Micrarchaeia archaeon]
MERKGLLSKPVRDFRVKKGMSVAELIGSFGKAGGFTASHLARAAEILHDMLTDDDCTRFLSFPACIVSTGVRGVLAQAVRKFDAIITTCGTLDHDLARAWGGKYYAGAFELDDWQLHAMRINRLGNVLVPNESYGETLERGMKPVLEELASQKKEWGARELIEEFGKRVKDEGSILRQAAKYGVPVFVPGITDGAFGTNLFIFAQEGRLKVDVLRDEKELSDLVFDAKRLGALILGGGISKHHVIWWSQFKKGLDYAVYITTASEFDGSLSGARLREAVSWGKVKERAKFVTVDGDATVLFPLLWAAVGV